MKHVLLALCIVLSGCKKEEIDNRLIVINFTTQDTLEVERGYVGCGDFWEAKERCVALGEGWRPPTIEELRLMYQQLHLKGKGDFMQESAPKTYWSSTEWGGYLAWHFNFETGVAHYYNSPKTTVMNVRAVRALN
jgi:hypothetical protein